MGECEFLVVGPLNRSRISCHAYTRIRLAQISRRTFKTLLFAAIGTRCRVTVLQHRIGREMRRNRAERTEGGHPAHKLDSLQFAAKLQFEHIAKRKDRKSVV